MSWSKKIRNFYQYPPPFKSLLREAVLESIKNEFYLKTKRYDPIKDLHRNELAEATQALNQDEVHQLKQVSKAMRLLEKYAPWRPKCYNRALTAKRLLARRGFHTRLHVGFRKTDGAFDGHAWITYRGKFVTGYLPQIRTFNELRPTE